MLEGSCDRDLLAGGNHPTLRILSGQVFPEAPSKNKLKKKGKGKKIKKDGVYQA